MNGWQRYQNNRLSDVSDKCKDGAPPWPPAQQDEIQIFLQPCPVGLQIPVSLPDSGQQSMLSQARRHAKQGLFVNSRMNICDSSVQVYACTLVAHLQLCGRLIPNDSPIPTRSIWQRAGKPQAQRTRLQTGNDPVSHQAAEWIYLKARSPKQWAKVNHS